MSLWSTLGDIGAGIVSAPLNILGVNVGQDKLFSSSSTASAIKQSQQVVAAAGASYGLGGVSKPVQSNVTNANILPTTGTIPDSSGKSVYTSDESILQTIAKAFGGQINFGQDGKVTGTVEIGRPQTTPLIQSFSKNIVWIVLGAIVILVLILKKRR